MVNTEETTILFIYADKRALYLAQSLSKKLPLKRCAVELNVKKPVFLKNLFLSVFDVLKGKHLPDKISSRLFYYSALRRPSYIKTVSGSIAENVDFQKPNFIIQWGTIFASYVDYPVTPFALVIDNYMESPNSTTKNNRLRKWVSLYDNEFYSFQKQVFQNASLIFTLSKWCRGGLINEFNVAPEKVIAVGWGPAKEISLTLDSKKVPKTILAVGNDYRSKGIDVLLDCAPFLKDFQITIVGEDTSFKKIVFPENVQVKGRLPDNELLELFKSSECFFIFSEFDPSPHVIWEAQASGCLIIGYDAYGIAESVINNQTGLLLQTRDPWEISQQIQKLYSDTSLVQSFRKAAIENYKSNGTWEATSDKILNCLKSEALSKTH
jgi:glycosyltransferase involved in cell wall biosynthesis